jgi:excisionase family DNA binding protein
MAEPRRSSAPLTADAFLTSAEVATRLKLPRSTVEDYARRGLLPSVKLGRHRRYVWNDVLRTMQANGNGGGPGEVVSLPHRRRVAS